ncbi:MAG: hypothetical protein U5K76_02765 [Woeseiaceae bacterium]|nr:hypothetical protein [Woeseiaceae bacterium]
MSYSEKLFDLSKQHPAANSLQKEAEIATQKSIDIQSQPEHVAMTVVRDGAAFLRRQGKSPNNRLYTMRNRYGSWTAVHVHSVNKGFGGEKFEWLCLQNKMEFTSEWFVARFARHFVSEEMLIALDNLLAADVAPCDKAA